MHIQEDPVVAAQMSARQGPGLWGWVGNLPVWEKVALALALAAVAGGGVAALVTGEPAVAQGEDALGADLATTGVSALSTDAPDSSSVEVSVGVLRLGMSFLAGFCIGLFLRAVLKLAAVAVGFWLVMTSALSYAGLISIDWDAVGDLWASLADLFETEWRDFQAFMFGSLPATGLAIGGFAVGFRRR